MRGGVEPERIRVLRGGEPRPGGRFVLYWMQASQRVAFNPALNHAVARANALGLPLVVGFGLDPAYPDADERHYAFMLEGLAETAPRLRRMGCAFSLRLGSPPMVALELARDAALVVCDRGYLRHQVAWRERVAEEAGCPVDDVEGDTVVPVALAADHALFQALHLRTRFEKILDRFMVPLPEPRLRVRAPGGLTSGLDTEDPGALLRLLSLPRRARAVPGVRGGAVAAGRLLDDFVERKLGRYAEVRGDPSADASSRLSPYLHFGQVSALEAALRVRRAGLGTTGAAEAVEPGAAEAVEPGAAGAVEPGAAEAVEPGAAGAVEPGAAVAGVGLSGDGVVDGAAGVAAFIEELVVRRELAVNHVVHRPGYDGWEGLPAWARSTLTAHAVDPRGPLYDAGALEAAATADPYWNAAMVEIEATGWLPNHMRMYWGKKILEWSARPEDGLALAVALNDRWFLDGRDPNSYAGVLWCFGLHDRPWKERPVFGTVRCMTGGGLERKFDMSAYLERVRVLTGWEPESTAPPRGRSLSRRRRHVVE